MATAPFSSNIDHFAAYDLWANSLFVKRLDREPPELLDRPVPSSFPSLRATLLHIRDAQNAWLCRLTGTPVEWPAEADTSVGTVLKHNVRLRDHVAGLSPAGLEKIHSYQDLRGNNHQNSAWQMIMHCMNHGTYHRGQLVAMMRTLVMDEIPRTDLILYFRSLKQG